MAFQRVQRTERIENRDVDELLLDVLEKVRCMGAKGWEVDTEGCIFIKGYVDHRVGRTWYAKVDFAKAIDVDTC